MQRAGESPALTARKGRPPRVNATTGTSTRNASTPPGRSGGSSKSTRLSKTRGTEMKRTSVFVCLLAVLAAGACGGEVQEEKTVPVTPLKAEVQSDGTIVHKGDKAATFYITESESREWRSAQAEGEKLPEGVLAAQASISYVMGCNGAPEPYPGEVVCRSGTSYTGQCEAIMVMGPEANNFGMIDLTDIVYPDGTTVNDRCKSWKAQPYANTGFKVRHHKHIFGTHLPFIRSLGTHSQFGESWTTQEGTSNLEIWKVCTGACYQ